MSMTRPNSAPKVPTLPSGEQVASYATYLEAQKAVDYLSDNKFAVEFVTIVGTDLRMVERVMGRLTYGRVALAGLASGAWFGLFVGLLLYMFNSGGGLMLAAIGLGAGFGLLFSVLSYSLTGGKRDFTSSSQIVASSYALLCLAERAGDARRLLSQMPDGAAAVARRVPPVAGQPGQPGQPAQWGQPGQASGQQPGQQGQPWGAQQPQAPAPAVSPVQPSDAPAQPAPPVRTPDPRWTTPSGAPRYGAMRSDVTPTAPADGAPVEGQGAPAADAQAAAEGPADETSSGTRG
ncbi:general stress protein [Oerskovia turbata]|uniref:general stress protein n=1 Tax=Oerskovia turbata TaxID=1713 RepID=UPI00068EB502|nr:general stress protein [Oerskovia turbata]